MTNPVHYINRESDGTTYWHTDDGWMAAPTQIDDTPDLDCAMYVVDFEFVEGDLRSTELAAWLRTKVCEGGDGCGAPPSVRPYSIKFGGADQAVTVHYCDDCAHYVQGGWLADDGTGYEVKLVEGGAA
jgi:hypothetical protein